MKLYEFTETCEARTPDERNNADENGQIEIVIDSCWAADAEAAAQQLGLLDREDVRCHVRNTD